MGSMGNRPYRGSWNDQRGPCPLSPMRTKISTFTDWTDAFARNSPKQAHARVASPLCLTCWPTHASTRACGLCGSPAGLPRSVAYLLANPRKHTHRACGLCGKNACGLCGLPAGLPTQAHVRAPPAAYLLPDPVRCGHGLGEGRVPRSHRRREARHQGREVVGLAWVRHGVEEAGVLCPTPGARGRCRECRRGACVSVRSVRGQHRRQHWCQHVAGAARCQNADDKHRAWCHAWATSGNTPCSPDSAAACPAGLGSCLGEIRRHALQPTHCNRLATAWPQRRGAGC